MRHIWIVLLLILSLLGPAVQSACAAEKRRKGQESKLKYVREKRKVNLKPLVYNPKIHRPQVVKQKKRERYRRR